MYIYIIQVNSDESKHVHRYKLTQVSKVELTKLNKDKLTRGIDISEQIVVNLNEQSGIDTSKLRQLAHVNREELIYEIIKELAQNNRKKSTQMNAEKLKQINREESTKVNIEQLTQVNREELT